MSRLTCPLSWVLSFLKNFPSNSRYSAASIPVLSFQSVTLYFISIFCENWKVFSEGKLDKCRVYLFPFFQWLKSFWFFQFWSFPISSTVVFSYFVQSKYVYSRKLIQPKNCSIITRLSSILISTVPQTKLFSDLRVPKCAISLPKISSLLLFDQLASNYLWCLCLNISHSTKSTLKLFPNSSRFALLLHIPGAPCTVSVVVTRFILCLVICLILFLRV